MTVGTYTNGGGVAAATVSGATYVGDVTPDAISGSMIFGVTYGLFVGVGVGEAAFAELDDEVVVLLVVVPDEVVLFVEFAVLVVLLDELVLGVVEVELLRELELTLGRPEDDVEADGLGVTLGTVDAEYPPEAVLPEPETGDAVERGDGVELEEPPLAPVT